MTDKNTDKNEIGLDKTLANTTHKVEDFYFKNKKNINIALVAVIVIVAGYFGLKKFYFAPMETEAQTEIFKAQKYFEMDSFALAVKGNDKFKGFADIASEYGSTKIGNLAHYYAGICYLRTGDFASAIDQLEDFSTENELVAPLAEGALGDAYVESGNMDDGVKHYLKAARMSKNKLTSPVFYKKAGLVYEEQKDYGNAVEVYSIIKKDYKESMEGNDIDKYIARATALKEGK